MMSAMRRFMAGSVGVYGDNVTPYQVAAAEMVACATGGCAAFW
jgi:hypothetical protein